MSGCVCLHVTPYMWRSADRLQAPFLSEDQTQVLGTRRLHLPSHLVGQGFWFFTLIDSLWISHHVFRSHLTLHPLTSALCPCECHSKQNKILKQNKNKQQQKKGRWWGRRTLGSCRVAHWVTVYPPVGSSLLASRHCPESAARGLWLLLGHQ